MTPRAVTGILLAAIAGFPMSALADGAVSAPVVDKQACNDAYGKAQTLRDAHKLSEARTELRICAQKSCAAFVVSDCTAWLVDTEARIPSVVLIAKDAEGNSLSDVSVSLDGVMLQPKLDGHSVEVDPGMHTFGFASAGGTKVDKLVLVAEGQKAQTVTVTFAGAGTAAVAPLVVSKATAPAVSTGFWTSQHVAGAAVGGVGTVGLILGAVFGGLAASEASAQNVACGNGGNGPTCANHSQAETDHTAARTDGAVSTVGFVAGGVLGAVGIVLLITGRHPAEPVTANALVVEPIVGPQGGGVALRMQF